MCVFSLRPMRKYITYRLFINVDYQQAQDIQLVLVWCGIGPALDRVSRLIRANVTVHKHYIHFQVALVIFSGGRQVCYTLPPPPTHL